MNYEALQQALTASLTWRKREIQQARDLAENARSIEEPYLCRAWTLVMYAHCDQYIKEASRMYLEFLRYNPRESYDYWSIWRAFRGKQAMLEGSDGPNFDAALNPDSISKQTLINAIANREVIDSGNFNYKRLRFLTLIVMQIDFDCNSYIGFCRTLKTKRDEIAHGERSLISEVDDCAPWFDPTLSLLDGIHEAVLSVASQS
ncbi:MAG: MAE_28990/MAE_18760 family HEPN-like nuclease [Cohaesibacter sp.]|nr:MAE_28990/MAE_18760 family HEPN-like nuclease [Cohaesibacter sp.]